MKNKRAQKFSACVPTALTATLTFGWLFHCHASSTQSTRQPPFTITSGHTWEKVHLILLAKRVALLGRHGWGSGSDVDFVKFREPSRLPGLNICHHSFSLMSVESIEYSLLPKIVERYQTSCVRVLAWFEAVFNLTYEIRVRLSSDFSWVCWSASFNSLTCFKSSQNPVTNPSLPLLKDAEI